MKNIFIITLLLVVHVIFSQTKISGKVIHSRTKANLGFVDISVPKTDYYISTNVDGTFYLEVSDSIVSIEANLDGYISKIVPIKKGANYDLIIELSPTDEQINEVVIKTSRKKYKNKKENPAYRILREVWARRKKNGLRLAENYQYEEYEKIQFDLNNIDSAFMKKKIFRKLEFVFNNVDTSSVTGKAFLPIYINESISNVVGQNKPNSKEKLTLIANKSSGFNDNQIIAQTVKNLYKEYDIYENRMNFFTKGFVSPIATDGFFHYEYELRDSLNVDGIECYRIKYYPKRKGELTFKGTFYITKENYAVKEVTLATTKGINVNFVKDIYVELQYDQINDSIFVPKKTYTLLDFSFISKKDKAKGFFAHRTTSFKNYKFNETLPDNAFKNKVVEFEETIKDDSYWANNRHFELAKKEKNIYTALDSLEQVPKFKKFVGIAEIVASGYYNVFNAFDIGSIYSIFGNNDIEGTRIRLGGRTYFSRNDTWRAAGYLAYGFGDEKFKYAAEVKKMFNKNSRFILGLGVKRDIEQLGSQLTTAEGVLTRSFGSSAIAQRGNNISLSNLHIVNAFSSVQIFKNTELRLDGVYQTISSASPDFKIDYKIDGITNNEVTDSHIALSLLMRPGVKYSLNGIDRYEHSSLSPTILLKYTKGLNGVIDSGYEYDKVQFYYSHPILIGSVGKLDLSFEAGKIFQRAPLSLLSAIPGNQSLSIVPNVFSQLNYYEFVTDTYSTLTLDHHFNGRIFGFIPLIKKLKLREVAFFRTAWGSISDRNKEINASTIQYSAPDKDLYYEYGFGIENIGIGNFRLLRLDFNWRGNYLDKPDISKFGIKFGFGLRF